MNGIRVMHLSMIIGIIYLSGISFSKSLLSDDLHANLTQTITENIQTTEETAKPTATTSPQLHNNGIFINSSASSNNGTKISQSTETADDFEFEQNVTLSYNGSFHGNGTLNPENLTLDHVNCSDLGVRETAGFVAIGFLGLSVIGYVVFVLWRRYLQNKYGNGQTLITEDVYDISDLRHFEI